MPIARSAYSHGTSVISTGPLTLALSGVSGSSTAGSLTVASISDPSDITAFTITSSVGGSNLPFAIGHVFKQGDVPSGTPIGGDSSLQATIKNTWPDGSAKFALVSGRKTLSAGVASTVTLRTNGTVTGGSALTTTNLKTAMSGQTCSIGCGAFGTVSWATTDFDSPFQTWVSGPEMSSWVYRKQVGSDAHLVGWIEVRLFVGGQVEVLPWIENGYLNVASPTSKSATYTFTLGSTQRESLAIDLPSHCRTPLVSSTRLSHWLSTDPGITCRHSATYMMASRLVPSYSAVVSSAATVVTNLASSYTPLQVGNFEATMGAAGYQSAIGLLPEWDVLYLTTSGADAKVYGGVVRNGYSAGRWSVHFRDESTNRPIRFSQYPNLVAHTNTGASTTGSYTPTPTGTGGGDWDIPHHPSMGYMAYLVTGRWMFMEEVLFAATYNFLYQPDAVRQTTAGIFRPSTGAATLRGAAWALRTLAQATTVCADADTTIKAEFVASMESNIAFNHTRYVATTNNPYGMVETYGDNSGPTDNVWTTATWQQDFFTAVAGYMYAMTLPVSATNRTKVGEFFQWKAKSIVGRLSAASDTTGFLYRDATPYTITIALNDNPNWDTGAGPWPSSWRAIYNSTYSASNPDNPSNPGPYTDGDLRGGNFPNATSYWGNMLPAIAYAVEHQATGAAAAYARMTSAGNWSTFATNLNTDPVWSVKPFEPSWRIGQAVNEWREISNTLLSNAPTLSGAPAPLQKQDAWCGWHVDQRTGKVYTVGQGGHNDYHGNEVDVIDLMADAPAWAELLGPTPSASVTDNENFYADGRPTSIHGYHTAVFIESLDRALRFPGGSRSISGNPLQIITGFNIATGAYDVAGAYADPSASLGAGNGAYAKHPTTEDVYCWFYNDRIAKWTKGVPGSWTTLISNPSNPAPFYTGAACDPTRGTAGEVFFLGGGSSNMSRVYDIGSNTLRSITLTGTDISGDQGLGLVYVAATDKYYARVAASSGSAVYVITPNSGTSWTCSLLSTTGGTSITSTSGNNAWGAYTKFLYIARLGGVVYGPRWSSNLWFLRLH